MLSYDNDKMCTFTYVFKSRADNYIGALNKLSRMTGREGVCDV